MLRIQLTEEVNCKTDSLPNHLGLELHILFFLSSPHYTKQATTNFLCKWTSPALEGNPLSRKLRTLCRLKLKHLWSESSLSRGRAPAIYTRWLRHQVTHNPQASSSSFVFFRYCCRPLLRLAVVCYLLVCLALLASSTDRINLEPVITVAELPLDYLRCTLLFQAMDEFLLC